MGFLGKTKEQPTKLYHLEKLADLWLSPQAIQNVEKSESEQIKGLKALEWEYDETREFWKKYVVPYLNLLYPSGLLPTIQSLMQILEDAQDAPSVDKLDPETPEAYKVLTGVTLRKHSITVTQNTFDYMRKNHGDFQPLIGKVIIAGLAHDIGINIKEVPGASHSINGAKWCKNKLSGKDGVQIVIEAIRLHHAEGKDLPKNNPILPSLIRFNHEARMAELAEYEKQQAEQRQQAEQEPETPPADRKKEVDSTHSSEEAAEAVPETEPETQSDTCDNPFGGSISQEAPEAETSMEREKDSSAADAGNSPFADSPDAADASPAATEKPAAPQEEQGPPADAKPAARKNEKWLTQDRLYDRLVQKISPAGFDAFVFEGLAYFKPKVVREVLLKLADENGGDELANLMADLIDHLIEKYGFENHQAKLKFAGKTPPQKAYYFVIDKDKLPLPMDLEELPPREIPDPKKESNGKPPRFLKKIIILK